MRRLIALLALLPTVASSQVVCSTAAQSETTCSAVEQSITTTSVCECVASVAAPAGPFGGHATLTDGLVSYWPLDEESGTRVDIVGTNDLTDNNTVGFATVTGPPNFPAGKAASFVAANNESLSATVVGMNPQHTDFSVAGWAYFDAANNQFVFSLGKNSAALKDLILTVNRNSTGLGFDGTGKANITMGDNVTFVFGPWPQASDPVLSADTWYWFYVEHDTAVNELRLYINNSLAITVTTGAAFPLDPGTTFLYLGALDSTLFSTTRLAHWQYRSRTLTAQERADLYNAGAGLFYED